MHRQKTKITYSSLKLVVATFLLIFFLGPIIWVIWGASRGAEVGFTFANYDRLITYGEGLPRYLLNTLILVSITVVVSLIVSLMAGYAFARLTFLGKNTLFLGILAILMVPHASLLIPLFIWLNKLHLINNLVGLALVMVMYQMPFSVYMMRNTFESIPKELDEAAIMEGANTYTLLTRILIPLALPGVITVGLYAFLAAWNEFITALVLLNDASKFTLPLALVNLVRGDFGSIDFGALQAGIVVSALPCILLFFLLQRYFMTGSTGGAIKG
jgi:multiple sugar transport system permease protein